EPDLRNRKPAQLRSRLRVEIAQQPIAQPVVRNRAQLLLDQLERTPKRRSPRQRLSKINTPDIEPHRAYAGQPPHRARQIHSRRWLLPTMTFKVNHNSTARRAATPPAPLPNRHHKRPHPPTNHAPTQP